MEDGVRAAGIEDEELSYRNCCCGDDDAEEELRCYVRCTAGTAAGVGSVGTAGGVDCTGTVAGTVAGDGTVDPAAAAARENRIAATTAPRTPAWQAGSAPEWPPSLCCALDPGVQCRGRVSDHVRGHESGHGHGGHVSGLGGHVCDDHEKYRDRVCARVQGRVPAVWRRWPGCRF